MVVTSYIDVRYPDCDPMGIVHHAVYPLWYEIGRFDFFKAAGFDYTHTHAVGVDPAMVSLDLRYSAPAHFPGQVRLETRVTRCEPKKIEFQYAIYQGEGTAPIATAVSFHIWTGPDMKSYNLAENLPEIYKAYLSAAEPA